MLITQFTNKNDHIKYIVHNWIFSYLMHISYFQNVFHNTFNCSDYTRFNNRVTSEYRLGKCVEGGDHDLIFKVLSNIWLQGLRPPTKNVNHDSRFIVWDSNPGLPTYEPAMLTTRLHLVVHMLIMLKYILNNMHEYVWKNTRFCHIFQY
jgi:hypothetical protein